MSNLSNSANSTNSFPLEASLFEMFPTAVYGCNADGMICFYNQKAANLWGRAPVIGKEKFCGTYRRFLIDGTELTLEQTPIADVLKTGNPVTDKVAIIERPDGTRLVCQVNIAPVRAKDGSIVGVINAFLDVTERVEMEKKLKEEREKLAAAVRIREEFLSAASHELKTPLTSLKLQVYLRQRLLAKRDIQILKPSQLQTMLNFDSKNLDRLAFLIDTMLDVSRISGGKLNLILESFDLCDLIREIYEHHAFFAAEAGCIVSLEFPKPIIGRWDRIRIEQVMTNLLNNAIKYGAGNPISIFAQQIDNQVEIFVCDQGCGVEEKDQERIFERFERGMGTSHVSGLGLGLYIARQITELHQGTIEIQSNRPQGTRFKVTLPLEVLDKVQAPLPETEPGSFSFQEEELALVNK